MVRADRIIMSQNKAPVYGMDKDIQARIAAKIDTRKMEEARVWVETVTGDRISELMSGLKSGVCLCHLINKISPRTVRKISKLAAPFKERENIEKYLKGCKALGMKETDCFTTMDLYEGKNIPAVVDNLFALGALSRALPGFCGPYLGVKHAKERKREWTDQQLRSHVGTKLTMGAIEITKNPSLFNQIDRSTGLKPSAEASRQTTGRYVKKDSTRLDKIVKNVSGVSASSEPSQQTQGSYGFQPKSETKAMGSIIKNPQLFRAQQGRAAPSAPAGHSMADARPKFPFGTKFNPQTGETVPKFDPSTGVQNW